MKAIYIILFLVPFFSCQSKVSSESDRTIKNGVLEVPENREDPDSRMIDIHYTVIPSKNVSDRLPIIFMQGGPGGSSLVMVPFFQNSPLNDQHDIILFDARGTGRSGAYCQNLGRGFLEVMAQDFNTEEEYNQALQLVEECKAELSENQVDLRGYSSNDLAADMETLREALGIDEWILLGGSYGTRLGFTYLREYDKAKAAVFMGLFPPEVNIYEGFTAGLDGALTNLFNECANDPTCNQKYPDLRNTFVDVITTLRSSPKTISYQGNPFVINAQDALLLIHQMLYQQTFISSIPKFIYALNADQDPIVSQAINRTAQTISFINLATYWSIQAREEHQFNEEDAIAKSLERYEYLKPGPAFFTTDQKIMNIWHSHRSESIETEPVNADVPILITNGLYDPITPIANARNAMKYLKGATLVEFPNDGHTTFNTCFFDVFEQFVTSGYQSVDGSCAAEGSMDWK